MKLKELRYEHNPKMEAFASELIKTCEDAGFKVLDSVVFCSTGNQIQRPGSLECRIVLAPVTEVIK